MHLPDADAHKLLDVPFQLLPVNRFHLILAHALLERLSLLLNHLMLELPMCSKTPGMSLNSLCMLPQHTNPPLRLSGMLLLLLW